MRGPSSARSNHRRARPTALSSGDGGKLACNCDPVWVVAYLGRLSAIESAILKAAGRLPDCGLICYSRSLTLAFYFSPRLRYLAYSKFLRYALELDEEKNEQVPGQPLRSIVITDLTTQKPVTEILPRDGEFICPHGWLPNDRLLFHEASGGGVGDHFEYDVRQNGQRKLDVEKASQLYGGDFHKDGSLWTYVTDSGLGPESQQHLHLVDLRSKRDRILVSWRPLAPARLARPGPPLSLRRPPIGDPFQRPKYPPRRNTWRSSKWNGTR